MRELFGTDGIRGKARQYPLDAITMFALGEALAHRVSGRKILLGMDTRESGPEIARALSAGAAKGGSEAVFIGVVPTPAVAFLCRTTDAEAAISISASHNPFEDNGVKIFGHDGMKLADSIEEAIEDELRALRRDDTTIPDVPLTENGDLIEAYERFLIEGVPQGALSGKKIVLDTGYGAAYRIAPEVFRRAGADVVVIHDTPNGRNINEAVWRAASRKTRAGGGRTEGRLRRGVRRRRRPRDLRRRRREGSRRRRDHLSLGASISASAMRFAVTAWSRR